MLELVEIIGKREGLGDLLADGPAAAARQIGKGAEKLAMEVKGQPLPMHEPRLKQGLGVGYAISPTGADHCHNIHDTLFNQESWAWKNMRALGVLETVPLTDLSGAKVRMLIYETNLRLFQNCALLCFFVPYTWPHFVSIVSGVTGWETSAWELLKVGERAMNMARAFNAREGFTAQDDLLPSRFFTPFSSGPLEGVRVEPEAFQKALATYYHLAGWDAQTGAPTQDKLEELGIGWVVQEVRR